ncbi:Transducin-like enhancer protein 4 [Chytridiales sp. JEL 0842]|nr:Transducin-like enhancer protein 4 [Chytridiales sp. JEL 0842]
MTGGHRLASLDWIEKIRDELTHIDARLDSMARERATAHAEYAKYFDMYYRTHSELQRHLDINGRYQAIINQLLPMLTPQVQDGVRQDMESIKQITLAPLAAPPQAPPLFHDAAIGAVHLAPHAHGHPSMHQVTHIGPGGVPQTPQQMPTGMMMASPSTRPALVGPPPPMNQGMPQQQHQNGTSYDGLHERERKGRGRPPKYGNKAKKMKSEDDHMISTSMTDVGDTRSPSTSSQHPGTVVVPPRTNSAPAGGPGAIVAVSNGPFPGSPSGSPAFPKSATLIASLDHAEVVCALSLSNPFSYVFTAGKGGVKIWDVENVPASPPIHIGTLECLDNYIRACKMTPDGNTLIVAGEVNYMVVCDIGTSTPSVVGRMSTPNLLTYALATSPDSKHVYACCSDGSVNVWDIATRSFIQKLGAHDQSATCCCLTADGTALVTGSLDHTVKVWDLQRGLELGTYGFGAQIFSLGVGILPSSDPDRFCLAVGMEAPQVDALALPEGLGGPPGVKRELEGHEDCVLSLKFGGGWFLTTGKDRKWILWRAGGGDTGYEKLVEMEEAASILCCEVSGCGGYVVTGSGENVANLYKLEY